MYQISTLTQIFGVRDGKKEKWKKKAIINHSIMVFFSIIYLAPLNVYTKFEDSGCHRNRELCDGIFIAENENGQIKGISRKRLIPEKSVTKTCNSCLKIGKKNEEIKGQISANSLILVYTIHSPIVEVCIKFQPFRPFSS